MKRTSLSLLIFATALVLYPQARVQLPTAAERFAMEVELCKQAEAGGTPSKCQLYGKIQIVDSFPDVKIQKVDAFPDIKVKWVDAFADKPGMWKKVDAFPDYKVKFVDAFPDYKIKEVDAFPGCD